MSLHSRRVGAFLIGSWLMGGLLMWFVASQSVATADRILTGPPVALAGVSARVQPSVMRELFIHEARVLNRHLKEAWNATELGIVSALLASSLLTGHRNRRVILAASIMLVVVCAQAFYVTPAIHALEAQEEGLSPTAALEQRDALEPYRMYRFLLNGINLLIGLSVAGRLLWNSQKFEKLQAAQGALGTTSGYLRSRTASSIKASNS